ncbi:hypothetical protein AAX29_00834 [Aliarcobacter thereius]|uniref:Uncharacterized protein n=1 Tax=Aliarcobacter thereius TaxID=544718 RepID=A0A1C0B864_9BACT|nr:hypothetical protein [Aliarcobacter thereius]OCL99784.1 hypothetical protein AAX29_00834 [Aliarcobacter thereius]
MLNDILKAIVKIPNEKKANLYSLIFLFIGIFGILLVNEASIYIEKYK